MRYLEGEELHIAMEHMFLAAATARRALCDSAQCGAIIVSKSGEIIGRGYNAPPQDNVLKKKCYEARRPRPGSRHDLTCCVHAEIRAGIDALRGRNWHKLPGSTLYFSRIQRKGGAVIKSGQPYCTLCSRFALDLKIEHFALWHEDGLALYDTLEYNDLSFANNQGP